MAGRFTEIKYFEGCLNPLTVYHHGKKYSVPCGKCSACLVNRANAWNFRLSDAIDNFPFSIFFTLTYNNHYIPKVHLQKFNGVYWLEFDDKNVRFNGKEDVLRDDPLPSAAFVSSRCWPTIQNFGSADYFAYSSKRDAQLWLKMLRRDVEKTFIETNILDYEKAKIRYYVISEYGPCTFRPHLHGVIFCNSHEVSEYLLQFSLYQNWKMCDKSLFDEYTHYCDNGCAGYLSAYLTCFSDLPTILKEREFKPFRLSSKSPALGFECFDKKEVFQKVSVGVIEYDKPISRIDASFVFQYPPTYMRGLFPKCFEFSELSYFGLYRVYGSLYTSVVKKGQKFDVVSSRLRENLRPIDYLCARRCYEFCVEYDTSPHYYLYLLDMYYYRTAMLALRYFYEWQETASTMEIVSSYINVNEYRDRYFNLDDVRRYTFDLFCSSFAIDTLAFCESSRELSYIIENPMREQFRMELDDVLQQMVKLKKVNEMSGYAPHFV